MQPFQKMRVYINEGIKKYIMKYKKSIIVLVFLGLGCFTFAEDDSDYLEFNDRNNVVHGVYLGLSTNFGQIKDKDAFSSGIKVAYVANQQFEVGFSGVFFYSEQNLTNNASGIERDIIGGYAGLHLEPIFFSKSRVNLSFPVMMGGGVLAYIDDNYDQSNQDLEAELDESDPIFVIEPGVNMLFNLSRYVQIEAGIKYRFSSTVELVPSSIKRINGFSAGFGIKVGVFNMGRNRYKKNL